MLAPSESARAADDAATAFGLCANAAPFSNARLYIIRQDRLKVIRMLPSALSFTSDMPALVTRPSAKTSAKCLILCRV